MKETCRGLHLLRGTLLLALARLRGKKSGVDVWDNTTLGDNDIAEELVQPVTMSTRTSNAKTSLLTPRRYGWQAGDDGGRYAASCYHAPRYPQARESQLQGTRGRQRGRL